MQWAYTCTGMNENDLFWKNYHFVAQSSFSEFGLLVGIAFIIKDKEYHDATACSNPGSNL